MPKTKTEMLNWIIGFIEGNSCFSVNINKLYKSRKEGPIIYIRPFFTLYNCDKTLLEAIISFFYLKCPIYQNVRLHTVRYTMHAKNLDDIAKILAKIKPNMLISKKTKETLCKFIRAYNWSKKHGIVFSEWDPKIYEMLCIKDEINTTRKTRTRSRQDWTAEIKKYLYK